MFGWKPRKTTVGSNNPNSPNSVNNNSADDDTTLIDEQGDTITEATTTTSSKNPLGRSTITRKDKKASKGKTAIRELEEEEALEKERLKRGLTEGERAFLPKEVRTLLSELDN